MFYMVYEAPHPILEVKPSNPVQESHFYHMYSQPYSFSHYPQLMIIDEDSDVDHPTVHRTEFLVNKRRTCSLPQTITATLTMA